jgi:hypothetical protein
MIVAWIFLAPIGLLSARYFKYLFEEHNFLGTKLWFLIHRPILILAVLVTIAGFIVILEDKDFKWIKPGKNGTRIGLAHSIFGILVIALSVIQVIYNNNTIILIF